MNNNLFTVAIAALTFLILIVFGTQHRGLLAWFRSLRAKKPASVSTPKEGIVVQSPSSATQQEIGPAQPAPTIAQTLAAKNYPRAARWADFLPALLCALGWLMWAAGLLVMLLSTFWGGLGSPLSEISNKLIFGAIFFIIFANLSPTIVASVLVIVESIRQLRL